jgi:hypothetical protein
MGRPKRSIDVVKVCENCGETFIVAAWEARRRDRKYCSLDCHWEHQKSFVDETFFEKPSAAMAYVLGLAITDGCILKRTSGTEFLSIKSIDKDLLEKVKALMKSEYGVYDCGLSDAGNTVWRIDIANEKIVRDVKKWGVHPRKTFTTTFPKLPQKYHADFVRGVFDGDGGAYIYYYPKVVATQVCILGTKELLDGVVKSVGLNTSVKPYRKISKIMFSAHAEAKRLYDFIYYGDGICLERKKTIFTEMVAYGSAENRKKRKLDKLAVLAAAMPATAEVAV